MSTSADERLVLSILADAGDLMSPEPQLWLEANAQSGTPITRTDLKSVLQRLEKKQQVIGISGEDYTKWKISANGKARLAEANL